MNLINVLEIVKEKTNPLKWEDHYDNYKNGENTASMDAVGFVKKHEIDFLVNLMIGEGVYYITVFIGEANLNLNNLKKINDFNLKNKSDFLVSIFEGSNSCISKFSYNVRRAYEIDTEEEYSKIISNKINSFIEFEIPNLIIPFIGTLEK